MMANSPYPFLTEVYGCQNFNRININSNQFTVGRDLGNSFVIPRQFLSRTHCKFERDDNDEWAIYNLSTFGTFLNDKLLEKNVRYSIQDGDIIRLCLREDEFVYRFMLCDNYEPPDKKLKIDKSPPQDMIKLRELEQELKQQRAEHVQIIQQMKKKEEEYQRDLSELKEKQEVEKRDLLEKVQNEIKEKESTLRNSLESEIKILQMEKQLLEATIKEESLKRESESEASLLVKQEILDNFANLLENELQCSICNELFIKSTTLNCMHTFCDYCIKQWKKKKNECAICRAKIICQNRSIALDGFIDKMIENLTPEMRSKREEIIQERVVCEIVLAKPRRARRNRPRGRGNAATTPIVISSDEDNQPAGDGRNSDIPDDLSNATSTTDTTSTASSSDSGTSTTQRTTSRGSSVTESQFSQPSGPAHTWRTLSRERSEWSDVSDENDELHEPVIRGIRGAYYGGYGYCFRCGVRGHWANGCPLRYN